MSTSPNRQTPPPTDLLTSPDLDTLASNLPMPCLIPLPRTPSPVLMNFDLLKVETGGKEGGSGFSMLEALDDLRVSPSESADMGPLVDQTRHQIEPQEDTHLCLKPQIRIQTEELTQSWQNSLLHPEPQVPSFSQPTPRSSSPPTSPLFPIPLPHSPLPLSRPSTPHRVESPIPLNPEISPNPNPSPTTTEIEIPNSPQEPKLSVSRNSLEIPNSPEEPKLLVSQVQTIQGDTQDHPALRPKRWSQVPRNDYEVEIDLFVPGMVWRRMKSRKEKSRDDSEPLQVEGADENSGEGSKDEQVNMTESNNPIDKIRSPPRRSKTLDSLTSPIQPFTDTLRSPPPPSPHTVVSGLGSDGRSPISPSTPKVDSEWHYEIDPYVPGIIHKKKRASKFSDAEDETGVVSVEDGERVGMRVGSSRDVEMGERQRDETFRALNPIGYNSRTPPPTQISQPPTQPIRSHTIDSVSSNQNFEYLDVEPSLADYLGLPLPPTSSEPPPPSYEDSISPSLMLSSQSGTESTSTPTTGRNPSRSNTTSSISRSRLLLTVSPPSLLPPSYAPPSPSSGRGLFIAETTKEFKPPEGRLSPDGRVYLRFGVGERIKVKEVEPMGWAWGNIVKEGSGESEGRFPMEFVRRLEPWEEAEEQLRSFSALPNTLSQSNTDLPSPPQSPHRFRGSGSHRTTMSVPYVTTGNLRRGLSDANIRSVVNEGEEGEAERQRRGEEFHEFRRRNLPFL